jgi:TM2 domain-containing membrane protein YozV
MSQRNERSRGGENNRIIAGLLAFIGGTFGIHKFYLGDIGGGIFYVFLFFITIKFFPVTMILGIIEALRLFKMDPETFDEKYNKGIRGKSRRFQGKNQPRYTRDEREERSETQRRRSDRTNGSGRKENPARRKQMIPRRNPFKTSGMQKYKDFDLEEAVVDFNKALKIAEKDPDIHFYLAAVYSLTEQKEKAFKHLELAVESGLKDVDKIETFEDLAFVRIQNEFEAFKKNGFKMVAAKPEPKIVEEDVLDDDILLSQLNKLDELRKRGLISNEEFQIEKEKLIDHRK